VIKKVGSWAYKLQIPKMWKNLHPVINESKLKPYHRPTFTQQRASLTVIIPNQESSTQEVERMLNSRIQGARLQYLVKWQGQPFEESTWEDRSEVVKGASQLCQDFHSSHPDAPRVPTIRMIVLWCREDATLGGGNVMTRARPSREGLWHGSSR